jgi:EAL domain-containing protein (putative c-di-GMP-specific phosphodiesterase class I)
VQHGGAFDEQQFRENVEGTARRVDPTGKGVRVRAGTLDMSDTGVEGEDAGRALAYCIDRFAEENIEDISAWAMSGALTGQLTETRNRVASFRKAVGAREFDLVYQPIVELKTRQMHHLEALARFADTPSPASTVAFAEAVRLIGEFDLAVCARIVDVLEHAPPGQLPVAVNISGGSLDNAGFRKALRSLARSHAALAPLLMFEITESAAIKRLDYANETIQELRQLGFRVCLDDFGAGANSFHYLRGFAVDFVKIDGAFARAAASNSPRDKSLLRCIAEFCEENRIATIAEMIERESEARSLLELGIGFGQGYLFGRPSPHACAIVSEARPPKAAVRRPR